MVRKHSLNSCQMCLSVISECALQLNKKKTLDSAEIEQVLMLLYAYKDAIRAKYTRDSIICWYCSKSTAACSFFLLLASKSILIIGVIAILPFVTPKS